ncbi:hypothetical protein Tco_0660290 [Tanacetum coccineum]
MSDSEHSTVSYTSISSDSNPLAWGIPLMDADEVSEMDPYKEVAQQGQVAPPSPAYAPDPIELEDHVPVYVSEPVYQEYLALFDDEIPMEDQPLLGDASPVALLPGYIADSDLEEDEEDPADYPFNGGDDDDESSDDDDDDEEEEDEEKEEHLALANSTIVASPAGDPVSSAEEIESFETDESAAIPPPPPAYCTTARIAAGIRLRVASPLPLPAPSTSRRADIPEANILPQKRLLITAPIPRFEVRESSAATTRQSGSTMARGSTTALWMLVYELQRGGL